MTSIADNFNRANADLNGSTTSDGLATWVVQSGAFSVFSNQAKASASTTDLATIDTANANGTVQVTVPSLNSPNKNGLLVRYVDNSNYFYLGCATGGNGWVAYVQSGGANLMTTFTGAAGDVLSAVCSGGTITFKRNGTTITTDSSGRFSTATKFGLYGELSSGQTYDDWSFTDGAAPPAPRRPRILIARSLFSSSGLR